MWKCEFCGHESDTVHFKGKVDLRNGRYKNFDKPIPIRRFAETSFEVNTGLFIRENNLNVSLVKTMSGVFSCTSCGIETKIYSF